MLPHQGRRRYAILIQQRTIPSYPRGRRLVVPYLGPVCRGSVSRRRKDDGIVRADARREGRVEPQHQGRQGLVRWGPFQPQAELGCEVQVGR